MMNRDKIRLIVVQKKDSKWMQIHFCRLLQRGASVIDASPQGVLDVVDVADLWFPVPVGTDLFEAVECILITHKVAHHLVHLNKVGEIEPLGAFCGDWEAVFSPVNATNTGEM
ncbi:hypothetical protein [Vibrio cincinnatiensis]|uniref:hypothetical protein n=2 Tax=Vibrionaceae TaxID=641 RepID=UPI001EDED5E9|nr:hypothetical protein [Vibrio cincinnatiensis]MCG3740716.1 hypothetical protein [Vibrio cincinnatiensis]MDA0115918.1 hypothetical protein [Vibrio sp. 2art]HCG6405021.1 hypothetical protein [Vibrio parahaemolyticus]